MESWHKVDSAPFDAALFGFGPEKVKKMNQLIELETEALNKLRQALGKKNKEMIIKTAKGVKPNYAQLYKLFGDFDSIMGKKA